MLRHKLSKHQEILDEVDEKEAEHEIDDQSDEEVDKEIDSEDEDETEDEEEEEEDEDTEEDDTEEEEEVRAETYYDIWAYLRKTALNNPEIKEELLQIKERLSNDELDEAIVEEQANRVVKPAIVEHICEHYGNLLKLWHFAQADKHNKKVMVTKRKLMSTEDMDPVEAINHTVKKRKFLIRKATGLLDDEPLEDKVPPPQFHEDADEDDEEKEPLPQSENKQFHFPQNQ